MAALVEKSTLGERLRFMAADYCSARPVSRRIHLLARQISRLFVTR